MIPKIVHYCWLSDDPYPESIQKCIDSWKKYLPDYEFVKWDTNKFDINSVEYVKEAYEAKKYAFAADYIRLYALFNYGGIYLDSDVLVYKSFNNLLDLPYFIGQEYVGSFEAAVIGSEKGLSWIGEILQYYKGRAFVKLDGSYDMTPLPQVFFNILFPKYAFTRIDEKCDYKWDGKIFFLFHKDFFNSRNSIGPHKTKRSYCSHSYAGSWMSKKIDLKSKIKSKLPLWLLKLVFDFSHMTYKKAEIHKFDPIYLSKSINK